LFNRESWYQWERGSDRKREQEDEYSAKNVYMYIKVKMIPVKTVSAMGGGKDKRDWWRGESNIIYLMCCNFVNATMYHHSTITKEKKISFYLFSI
jgi:hypothetical protein